MYLQTCSFGMVLILRREDFSWKQIGHGSVSAVVEPVIRPLFDPQGRDRSPLIFAEMKDIFILAVKNDVHLFGGHVKGDRPQGSVDRGLAE